MKSFCYRSDDCDNYDEDESGHNNAAFKQIRSVRDIDALPRASRMLKQNRDHPQH